MAHILSLKWTRSASNKKSPDYITHISKTYTTCKETVMQSVMQADQINWPTTIGNLGLWTRLGIPTKATRFKTHQTVRFFVGVPCFFDFCVGRTTCAGRAIFILTNDCNSNPIPPHVPKTQKTVMQSVMRCDIICGKQGIIYEKFINYWCATCWEIFAG